jgi:N-acetylmuramoyl-L-alanine amidase
LINVLNAYIVAPGDFISCTDNVSALKPLAFSASHTDSAGTPCGLIAVDGRLYVGTPEELPAFVRYQDGRADIVARLTTEDITGSDFVISGTAIIVAGGFPIAEVTDKYVWKRENIKRIVIGLLEDGNTFVLFCTGSVRKLQSLLCAYGVVTALLITSGDVFFHNPRNGIDCGKRPVATLQARHYEEVPTPVVLIDPAHGGNDSGCVSEHTGLTEKELTLEMATEMTKYLRETYYGTFIQTRTEDTRVRIERNVSFAEDIQADFVYVLHVNACDGDSTGFESSHDVAISESTRTVLTDIHERIAQSLSLYDVPDNGMYPRSDKECETYPCPTFVAKVMHLDQRDEAYVLSNKGSLKHIAQIQAEALAGALGMTRRVCATSIVRRTDPKRYRVSVGEFQFKLGAEELCEKLRQKGFDAYIIRE